MFSALRGNIGVALAPMALVLLGFSWTIASPLGSSADEQFHASSIWCAWGESETCEIAPDNLSVNVPGAISKSYCYIQSPTGAGCLSSFIETSPYNDMLITSTYFSLGSNYSPMYFKVARAFVGLDVEESVLSIRMFNVVFASILLFWALAVGTPPVKRALALSWGLALIPVGIFFIASINPSSWLIFAIGTYWAFLATALSPAIASKRRALAWVGVGVSALTALGSRADAFLYLSITTLAIVVLQWRTIARHLNRTAILVLVGLTAVIGFLGWRIFSNRYATFNLNWGSDIPIGGFSAPFKTITELPSFFFGLFGGQGFIADVLPAEFNLEGIRTTGFVYGLGWMEFDLPSFIGVFGGVSALVVIFMMLRRLSWSKAITALILVSSFGAIVLVLRAIVDFTNTSHVQPRYFFPLLLASIGIILIEPLRKRALLSRPQGWFLVVALTFSGSVAWLAAATRYAVGPNAVITDFGQPYEWWWHIGPGRLGWFLITMCFTGLWLFATVWLWGRASKSTLDSNAAKLEVGA